MACLGPPTWLVASTGLEPKPLTLDCSAFHSNKQVFWSQDEGTCITEMICITEKANIQVCHWCLSHDFDVNIFDILDSSHLLTGICYIENKSECVSLFYFHLLWIFYSAKVSLGVYFKKYLGFTKPQVVKCPIFLLSYLVSDIPESCFIFGWE